MRSLILSCAAVVALGTAPAFAQMSNGPTQLGAPATGTVPPMTLRAPPQNVPMVHHPTNVIPENTRSKISPALPEPAVGPNATATEYLRSAATAINHHRLGEAQSALSHAQTYLLNRSVPLGTVREPDNSPAVRNIQAATIALARGQLGESLALIHRTIPMARQFQMAANAPRQPSLGFGPAIGPTSPGIATPPPSSSNY